MRSLRWLALCAMLGCGRLSFEPTRASSSPDAPLGDGTGAPDDSLGSAALGDALATVGTCPPPVVSETFGDGVLDPTWTAVPDPKITLSEMSSHLVFTYGSPATSGAQTTFTSPPIDLRNRCVTLTIAQLRGLSNAITGIQVGTASAWISVHVVGNQLNAIDNPLSSVPPSFTYDPVAHVQWRVQLGGGHVVATALDAAGNPTQLLRDLPTFFDEANAQISLYAGVSTSSINGGTAELEALAY